MMLLVQKTNNMVISMSTQIYDKHTRKHEKKKLTVNDHTDPEMIKILAKKKSVLVSS